MLYFKSITEAENVFKALSTPMRLKIMELIYENNNLSMNDLAEALGLTNGAISMHVAKLEEAGLIKIRTSSGKRGTMKIIRPRYSRLMIDLAPIKEDRKCYTDDIRVGYYTAAKVHGLAVLVKPEKHVQVVHVFHAIANAQGGLLGVLELAILYVALVERGFEGYEVRRSGCHGFLAFVVVPILYTSRASL